MADEKKAIPPAPSAQQTAATLAPIAAQPAPAATIAAQPAQPAAPAETNWFSDSGNAVLAAGSFLADRGIDALEAGMDQSRALRLVGSLFGLESPSMRQSRLRTELLEKSLAEQPIRQKMLEGQLAAQQQQLERGRLLNEKLRSDSAMQPLRNAAEATRLGGAIEQNYRKNAQDVAIAHLTDSSRIVGKSTESMVDPKDLDTLLSGKVGQEATVTLACLDMLASGDPAIAEQAGQMAQRYGITISRGEDGKTFLESPELPGGRMELNEGSAKAIRAQVMKGLEAEAQALNQLRAWYGHADGNGYAAAVKRLMAEGGVNTNQEAVKIFSALLDSFPRKDQLLFGAMHTIKQIYRGGVDESERPQLLGELGFLADTFGIKYTQTPDGLLMIEGRDPVEYADATLKQNAVQQALDDQVVLRQEVGKRILALKMAERGGIPGAEGAEEPQTVEDRESQYFQQQGQQLLASHGMENWAQQTADRINYGKKEDEQLPADYFLRLLGRTTEFFKREIADGKSASDAYKSVVKKFEERGLSESDIPDFFREAVDRAEEERLAKEYDAAKKEYDAAEKEYRARKLSADELRDELIYGKTTKETDRMEEAARKLGIVQADINRRKEKKKQEAQQKQKAAEQSKAAGERRKYAEDLLTPRKQ